MLTHLPSRSWCEHCVAGKFRDDPHYKQKPGSEVEVPRVAIDYLFLGRVLDKSKAQEDLTVVELKLQKTQKQRGKESCQFMVIVDERTGATFSTVVAKGVNEHAIHNVVEFFVLFCGRQNVVLQTDAEPSI